MRRCNCSCTVRPRYGRTAPRSPTAFTNISAAPTHSVSASSSGVFAWEPGHSLIVLALSVALRGLLGGANGRGLGAGLAEGVLILGWVAMWRPIEILLYEHWESHLDHGVLERLADIPVDYFLFTGATPHA
jgi:hypothetical protein